MNPLSKCLYSSFYNSYLIRFSLRRADPELLRNLEAYSEGVNAFLKEGKLPFEFTLAGTLPSLHSQIPTNSLKPTNTS
jgi:acyl-homoserine lactone acylase PvdQ